MSVNADETSWREKLKKAWLWVAATALVVVFIIHPERSGKAARQLLGEDFVGFVGSDRWSGYNWVDIHLRQVCRVGGDVTAPAPHSPGRADFPHPVLHGAASLAVA